MTRRELVAVLRSRWWTVVLLALLVLAGTAAVFLVLPDTYAARATVAVSGTDPDLDLRRAYYAEQLVVGNYNPYADYFATLARQRAATSGEGTGEIRSATTVGTRSITVEVVGLASDPGRAAALAGGAADSFVQAVTRVDPAPGVTRPAVRARVEQPAQPPPSPSRPDRVLVALVGLVAAPTVGVAGALVHARAAPGGGSRRERAA